MPDTSVRIDEQTHLELKRLASKRGTTLGAAVKDGACALRQQMMGWELAQPLLPEEDEWLGADLG